MDIPDNPLLGKTSADPRPSSSTNVVRFEKPRKRVSAKTERLIGELGLRYRPSAQADLEEHAAALALLTTDVADVPPHLLEEAIRRHVTRSPYMPRASELIAEAQKVVSTARPAGSPDNRALAARYNLSMSDEHRDSGLRWCGDDHDLWLERA